MTKRNTRRGFTLIELLVMVLIIGILAAVALPQYQKAVIKARFAEAKINLQALAQAQQACMLETEDPSRCQADQLDISIGEGGTKYRAPDDSYRFTENFIYESQPSTSVVDAGYRKDNVCLVYKITTQEFVLGQSVCPNDREGETPLYDYEALLGLTTDTSIWCC